MRLKAIWCLIWHRHQNFGGKKPSANCRKCGMYFRWPSDKPGCFKSNPGPQSRAENDCAHCPVSAQCLP